MAKDYWSLINWSICVGCLVCCVIDRLIDRPIDRSVGRVGRFWLNEWFCVWLIDRRSDRCNDRLIFLMKWWINSFVDRSLYRYVIDQWINWSIGWLTDWWGIDWWWLIDDRSIGFKVEFWFCCQLRIFKIYFVSFFSSFSILLQVLKITLIILKDVVSPVYT